jgi:hypothetical protein
MVQMSARQEAIVRSKREPIMRVLPGPMLVMLLGALERSSLLVRAGLGTTHG